jgi:hypothetical protein
MEKNGIHIIQASNQQIAVVHAASLAVAGFSYSLLSARWTSFIIMISIGLPFCSAFLSFGYLMLLTSTFERTGSYMKSRELCNNLAFASSSLAFFSIVALTSGFFAEMFESFATSKITLLPQILAAGVLSSITAVFYTAYCGTSSFQIPNKF